MTVQELRRRLGDLPASAEVRVIPDPYDGETLVVESVAYVDEDHAAYTGYPLGSVVLEGAEAAS